MNDPLEGFEIPDPLEASPILKQQREEAKYRFVTPPAGRPKPVGELSERAERFFENVCAALEQCDALSIVDGAIIHRYAVALDAWLAESAELGNEGYVLKSGIHKTPIRNPRQAVCKSLSEDVAKCERALGFSPEARCKLHGFKLNGPLPKKGND